MVTMHYYLLFLLVPSTILYRTKVQFIDALINSNVLSREKSGASFLQEHDKSFSHQCVALLYGQISTLQE